MLGPHFSCAGVKLGTERHKLCVFFRWLVLKMPLTTLLKEFCIFRYSADWIHWSLFQTHYDHSVSFLYKYSATMELNAYFVYEDLNRNYRAL